ncbi:BTB domain-containing protein [Sergentomyia squamirostris]
MAVSIMTLRKEDELWSGRLETLEDRMSYFVANDFLADMTFLVGEEKRRVPGHKFILSSCSWDFYNALHLLHIDNDELPIQDVPYESFLVFLRYCYTGDVNLEPENAINILKLAYRFDMKALIRECESEVWDMVRSDSCLKLLTQCDFLPKDAPLKIRILDAIAVNFVHLTENEEFMKIFMELSLKGIEGIADLEEISCNELKLVDTVMKWAARACEKNNLEASPQNLRQSLGNVFYKIRFPAMKPDQFIKVVGKYPAMLSTEEISNIGRNMKGDTSFCLRYSNIPRGTDPKFIEIPEVWPDLKTTDLVSVSSLTVKEASAREFSLKFKVRTPRKLVGFSVIARKSQMVVPASCFLGESFYNDPYAVEVTLGGRYELNSDPLMRNYHMIPLKLIQEQDIYSNSWYTITCKFHERFAPLPDLADFVISSQNIQLKKIPDAIIPFLYFAKDS